MDHNFRTLERLAGATYVRTRFRDFVVHLGGDMSAHHLEMLVHAVPKKLDLPSHLRGFVVFLRVVQKWKEIARVYSSDAG